MSADTCDRETLRILFDCAVGSMDFSSGMLDDEEVSALRSVAKILDVDPMTATPSNFQCKYGAPHQPWTYGGAAEGVCMNCRQMVGNPDTIWAAHLKSGQTIRIVAPHGLSSDEVFVQAGRLASDLKQDMGALVPAHGTWTAIASYKLRRTGDTISAEWMP